MEHNPLNTGKSDDSQPYASEGPNSASPSDVESTITRSAEALSKFANALTAKNHALAHSVQATLSRRSEAVKHQDMPRPEDYPYWNIAGDLNAMIAEIDPDVSELSFSPPPSNAKGTESIDLACNVARIAKKTNQKPQEVAEQLATKIAGLAIGMTRLVESDNRANLAHAELLRHRRPLSAKC